MLALQNAQDIATLIGVEGTAFGVLLVCGLLYIVGLVRGWHIARPQHAAEKERRVRAEAERDKYRGLLHETLGDFTKALDEVSASAKNDSYQMQVMVQNFADLRGDVREMRSDVRDALGRHSGDRPEWGSPWGSPDRRER